MTGPYIFRILSVLAVSFALVACDSSEERAEKHYQSGLSLLEAGDPERAAVEFRNVFQLNGSHRDARHMLAQTMLQLGNKQEAYSQYLRLVEQYPKDKDGRLTLSEIAFEARNWEELDRHGSVAQEIAPEDPRVKAIALGQAYRSSVQDQDDPARRAVVIKVEAQSAEMPDSNILRTILIDGYIRDADYDKALAELDKMIAAEPDNRGHYSQRLMVLTQAGDPKRVETQLKEMVALFPEDPNVKATLLRFYMARQDLDAAEAFLREIADPTAEEQGTFVSLVQFLAQVRGEDVARVELERAIEVSPNPAPFRALRAGYDFGAGKQDQAIADLEDLLKGEEPSDQTRNIQITLARMLLTTGNKVGARQLVEKVLEDDANNVLALKMQAAWHIEADETTEAISLLRTALDKSPEDAQAMKLMADAYTRSGSTELARDFLSLAVEASGNAPEESIRFARLLMTEERYLSAEDVILPALRLAPNNLDLLNTLGQLYLAMEDIPRTEQVIATLRRIESAAAQQAANGLEAAQVNQQQGSEQALSFLESLASKDDADLNTKLVLLRARLAAGETKSALQLATDMAAEKPEDDRLQFALAATKSVNDDLAGAEEIYRRLLDKNPTLSPVWLELARTMIRQGQPVEAHAVVDEGLAALPDDPTLLWAKASYLEREGNTDAAIEIYSKMYEVNSNSLVIANNLASLLATYREDPESLERAYVIARRLRGTDNPALQDTYGWIAHRRGDSQEALSYLEAAAVALSGDALVQYHLGAVYVALERKEEAIAQMKKAVELAGPADTRPQIDIARAEILRLQGE